MEYNYNGKQLILIRIVNLFNLKFFKIKLLLNIFTFKKKEFKYIYYISKFYISNNITVF